jgi:hypothetical protein
VTRGAQRALLQFRATFFFYIQTALSAIVLRVVGRRNVGAS